MRTKSIVLILILLIAPLAGCLDAEEPLAAPEIPVFEPTFCALDGGEASWSLSCTEQGNMSFFAPDGIIQGCTFSPVEERVVELTCGEALLVIEAYPVGERLRHLDQGCKVALLANGEALLECADGRMLKFESTACVTTPVFARADMTFVSKTCNGLTVNFGEPTSGQTLAARLTGLYDHDAGTFGTLEIPAYDPVTQRLFLVNVLEKSVDIVSLSDPSSPVLVDRVDLSRIGEPNSIDIRHEDGVLAIAVHREMDVINYVDGPLPFVEIKDKPLPGLVYFIDTSGTRVASVEVGYQPDMITFTPDGDTVLLANEAQPSTDYKVDPEGSVNIIDVSGPLSDLGPEHVRSATFHAFEAERDALEASGIRIFGPNANVSQDLEPEYITVSEDSTTAWIAVQEANAVAELDVATATITKLMPLGFKPHSGGAALHHPTSWATPPLGDLSGLLYLGPNASESNIEEFLVLSDSSPELHRVLYNSTSGTFAPTTSIVTTLQSDADYEDLTVCNRGGSVFVLGEESIPSLQLIGGQGDVLARLIPEGAMEGLSDANPAIDREILPSAFLSIEPNKGFEAVACHGSTLFAMTQSSLATEGSTEQWIRLLEIDLDAFNVTGQYLYPLELTDGAYSKGGKMDKVSAMVAISDTELLVIERDSLSGPDASKWVFRINIEGATNLMQLNETIVAAGALESMEMNELSEVEVVEDVSSSEPVYLDHVLINELASKVATAPANPYQDGARTADYIELFNPTAAVVDLSGWKIYDDPAKAYTFPAGSAIQAESYLFLFADDTNDGTLDFENTVDENGHHHLPIKLSSGGESVTIEDDQGNVVDHVVFPALSQDVSYGRVPDASTHWSMTDLTPEAANVVHTATSSGQTAADSGLKPVLKLPFVELGDRYGIKPEALAIVGQGHDLTFINDLQSVHPMNVNGGLEADSMVSLGQANISLVAGNFEGSGLDWCDALDGYVVANDGGSLLLVDEAGAAQVLFEDDAGGHDLEGVTCTDDGTMFAVNEANSTVMKMTVNDGTASVVHTWTVEVPVDLDDGKGLEAITWVGVNDAPASWGEAVDGFLLIGSQDDTRLHVVRPNASLTMLTPTLSIDLGQNDVAALDFLSEVGAVLVVHDDIDRIDVRALDGRLISTHATPLGMEDTEGISVRLDCNTSRLILAVADDEIVGIHEHVVHNVACTLPAQPSAFGIDVLPSTGWAFDPIGTIRLMILSDIGPAAGPTPGGHVDVRLHPLDGSDEGGYTPHPWPVMAMYMPDGITSYMVDGTTYLITGNEGDLRDYRTFNGSSGMLEIGLNEEIRIASVDLDPMRFPNADTVQQMSQLGRLNVPNNCGDHDGDGDLDYICGVGARSFSIWTTDLELVWDSGHELSQFSTHNGQHLIDEMNSRDDNKGIEPEGVKVGEVNDRTYLFLSMERSFGVMIYDITDPTSPQFQQWIQVEGSSNPEDMEFIPASSSPNGVPLLVVANEDSGTVGIWALESL